jgi:hypothetical protein
VDSLCTSRTPKCCADNADARMVSASGGALSSCFITTEGLDASAVPAPLRAWTPVYPSSHHRDRVVAVITKHHYLLVVSFVVQ